MNNRTAKVLLLGDASVGKTSLRSQFVHHLFSSAYRASVGADFLTYKVEIDDQTGVTLQIWDTAGQERFNAIGASLYRGTDVVILVYDITNSSSFSHLTKWFDNFLENSNVRNPVILLVGNKLDRADYRIISSRQAQQWGADIPGWDPDKDCFETSAKDNINVQKIFVRAAELAVSNNQDSRTLLDFDVDGRVNVEDYERTRFWRCC